MSADLIRQKARERHFLEQLLDGKKLENYKIPVPIKAELRKYQQVRLHFFFSFSHFPAHLHAFKRLIKFKPFECVAVREGGYSF